MSRKKNPAAVELGRLGGLVRSKAKTDAARENAKLGGRPRKASSVVDGNAKQGAARGKPKEGGTQGKKKG